MTYINKITSNVADDASISTTVFDRIASIAHENAGIVLSRTKESMVKSRLSRRLRALKIQTFEAYLDYLLSGNDPLEMSHFISALTTNVSHFFRESHHFDYLEQECMPELFAKLKAGKRVRIWSAGCSNGQEPYSIAMTLLKYDANIAKYDIKILATDIDPEVLRFASAGTYSSSMSTGLSEDLKTSFFSKKIENKDEVITVNSEVRELISFRQLNLHAEWPMTGQFDLIFCRNVIIYFDLPTQNKLFRRYAHALNKDGKLMIGHSERIGDDVDHLFKNVGVTTYQPTQHTT